MPLDAAPELNWSIKASNAAHNTINPIRRIVDTKVTSNPDKEVISLSIGDPLAHGNLETHKTVIDAIKRNSDIIQFSGYPPSTGYESARQAVADYCATSRSPLTSRDVILASGASGALELALSVLLNPGDNILLPKPGFPLYQTISGSKGFKVKQYDLLPEQMWEADVKHMRSLIDHKTRAILVNNPSNPCGCVYSEHHLREILAVAEEFKLPIVCDEIYAHMTFGKHMYVPLAELTDTVPILSIGGLAKRFLLPGWRLGWVLIHDHNTGIFDEVRQGLLQLSQLILGPNSLAQSVLSDILPNTPRSFFDETMKTLEANSDFTYKRIAKISGLKPVESQGTMYQMIQIELSLFRDIADDVDFMRKLLAEESVFILPGQAFDLPNFFRIVFCAPLSKLEEAYERMEQFCMRHLKEPLSAVPKN